jgi:DNA-directed RNA polymerase subunit RPC12/RpoP
MESMKLNPYKYPQITCDNCGHNIFRSAVVLNKIPGIAAGTGTEDIEYPTPVYVCDKCGTMLKSYREDFERLSKIEEEPKKSSLIL